MNQGNRWFFYEKNKGTKYHASLQYCAFKVNCPARCRGKASQMVSIDRYSFKDDSLILRRHLSLRDIYLWDIVFLWGHAFIR